MFRFCFNDCIPNNVSEFSLIDCLTKTLKEYNSLWKSFPGNVDGIITPTSLTDFLLNINSFSLAACIAAMESKDLRIFAYRMFTKYPVVANYFIADEDNLIALDYTITIAAANYNAINSVIVSENGGVLFTLGLHEDLRKNVLVITTNTDATASVNNLYGETVNTTFISDLIEESIADTLDNYGKLLLMIGENSCSTRFKKGFEESSSIMQETILEHFQKAIDRNGASPFFSDGDLIKDITPDKCEHAVFELRIFKPVAYRVYFYERGDKTFLALIEKKPAQKKQDNHIDAATSIINELLMLDSNL
jgi:hypothetical protein